jgi:thiamine pyrophosphate-dependent acetolactate synthase large subunit-like protein
MDLVNPEIDYLGLAHARGVRDERVDEPADLEGVLAESVAHAGPALVGVAIERDVRGRV